ncbi:MAG: PEP-CTERM sorting domain-containing protein [Fimbriimonadales bacterium]
MKLRTISGIALVLALGSIANAQSFFDDFNRANSGDLGSNWTNQVGALGIDGDRAFSTDGGLNQATVNGISNTLGTYTITVDADTNGAVSGYVAIVMAYAGTGLDESIFFKLQAQTGTGMWSNYAFYTGNNNGGGGYAAGGGFFSMTEAYRTARMTMSVSGADVTVEIDGGINGSIDDTFMATLSAGQMTTLGTGAGLGIWGNSRADNYNLVVPEPGTFVAIGIGLAGLSFVRRRRS